MKSKSKWRWESKLKLTKFTYPKISSGAHRLAFHLSYCPNSGTSLNTLWRICFTLMNLVLFLLYNTLKLIKRIETLLMEGFRRSFVYLGTSYEIK